MSSITIKHATIKFEKMDKKEMYVNASSASSSRAKVDKNYQEIVNAWKSIEKSFTNLEGKSSGKVKQMFTQAVSAAKAKSNAASKRKSELDSGLKKDVQSYAKALLDTGTLISLITALGGGKAAAIVTPEPSTPSTPFTPTTPSTPTSPSMPSYKHGESLGTIKNPGANDRYQGCSNFTDKNGNEYVAAVQCDRDANDYHIVVFKKDKSGNFQQISSKKIASTHGNSLTTKYNPKTNKVEIYTTKKYSEKDTKVGGDVNKSFDATKIGKYEYDLKNNKFGDSKIIDLGRTCSGAVSVDQDNNLYATSTGYSLSVSKGDFTNAATTYKLQGADNLVHQSGCIHGDNYYKVMWDNANNKNHLFTYDLTKKNADGKIPFTSKLIDSGAKREIEDVSWDKNLGLIVSINNLKTKSAGRSTKFIKV